MPYEFQVTVDSQRPHELADWWAETLGWAVERQDEAFIRRMIAEGHATPDETMMYSGVLVWRAGSAIRFPGESGGGAHPRLLFQLVPESKVVKNRLHLDVQVGAGDREATVKALTERGASYLHTAAQGSHTWVTMADPEGNEFCVT